MHRRDAFRAAPHSVNAMRELVADEADGFRARPGRRRSKGEDGKLSAATVRGEDGSDLRHRLRRAAAVLRPDHEARPDRRLGPEPARKPGAGRHREIRDQRAGHFRDRRHQHLSGQAEADPVRLPRSRARGAEGVPLRLSGQEAAVPIHDVLDEPAEEARGELGRPLPYPIAFVPLRQPAEPPGVYDPFASFHPQAATGAPASGGKAFTSPASPRRGRSADGRSRGSRATRKSRSWRDCASTAPPFERRRRG